MLEHLKPVALGKVYRLFNIGGTSLVSAAHEGVEDVMPATWVCPLDLDPGLVTAVIDKTHFTRPLIERSGRFALALPGRGIVRETLALGSVSKNDDPGKLEKSGAKFFKMPGFDMPFVEGCACYAVFDVISEPRNESAYDLFIGRCIAAWADDRVFSDGHWYFEEGPEELRTLHYVAGGHFYSIGERIDVK